MLLKKYAYWEDVVSQSDNPIALATTDGSIPGILLKAKEDACADAMMPYRFDSDDKLIMGDVILVRQR